MRPEFKERRQAPRTDLELPVEVRPFEPHVPPEYCTTFNISDSGFYLATSMRHYIPGMNVYVTGEFQLGSLMNRSAAGSVVRIDQLACGKFGVAIQIHSSL